MMSLRRAALAAASILLFSGAAGTARASGLDDPADQWLPFTDTADWVYAWSDSAYSPTPRTEHYTVKSRSGALFRLGWEEVNPPSDQTPSSGIVDYQNTDAGLVNLNYQSTPPPPQFPILCASA